MPCQGLASREAAEGDCPTRPAGEGWRCPPIVFAAITARGCTGARRERRGAFAMSGGDALPCDMGLIQGHVVGRL